MSIDREIRATPASSLERKSALRPLQWLLFLSLWSTYGILINSGNLNAFRLQHAGVEAYVERHHFYLEGSELPQFQFQPVVDVFLHREHLYPAKQPGQFMAGACAYFPLHALGLSYASNYLLSSALVTFLTASLVTAASAVAVFKIALQLSAATSISWPLLAALSYGLATTIFAYSGIAWHDTLATGYLTIALYLVVLLTRSPESPKRSTLLAACVGCLVGLTITTSMLLSLTAVVVALYFGVTRWKLSPAFLLGGLIGLTPLLIYNAVCFGNPLLVPNLAGMYSDTFFRPGWTNLFEKLGFYTRMVTLYVPIFWLGLIGLAFYPASLRGEKRLLLAMLLALAAYILNIEASGTCQYGPRYLLPAMPIVSLGLVGFSFVRETRKWVAGLVTFLFFAVSCFINLIGAAHGAMLCDYPHSAVVRYLSEMLRGPLHSYPLAGALALPFAACLILFVFTARRVITTSQVSFSLPPCP